MCIRDSFYIGQYVLNFALAILTTTVFLGGWQGPGVAALASNPDPKMQLAAGILSLGYMLLKAWIIFFVMVLLRGALPRCLLYTSLAEVSTYIQSMPYTDRLDYFNSMANNYAYALAVEALAEIEVPQRANYLRALMNELTRIQMCIRDR